MGLREREAQIHSTQASLQARMFVVLEIKQLSGCAFFSDSVLFFFLTMCLFFFHSLLVFFSNVAVDFVFFMYIYVLLYTA